ncbi:MAG: MerR family transcriptional regulator [Defluviitaleaceae bacterium]|nr:MerR family transcriptional regulator [Defluviitaleaceae bacterium]
MDLIKITDLCGQLGLTSRSLRYYEQVGLVESVRASDDKYRHYDPANIERLKQIIVLRKMLIPIKDIIRIYESEDMSIVVEVFTARIEAIDKEANALGELRQVVNDFLQTMLDKGIKKISALPILYEGMEKKFVRYGELTAISSKLAKPLSPSIRQLPQMRMLSSYLKDNPEKTDAEGFWCWVQSHPILQGKPFLGAAGAHERFEFHSTAGEVMIQKIPEDFNGGDIYAEYQFPGGLYASADVYLDEDLHESFRALLAYFDDNPYYEIDYTHDGALRHEALIENLLSPDEQRSLLSLFVPIKKRLPNPSLYGKPDEVTPITIGEIEKQNPNLWTVYVAPDKLIPINHPHYAVSENGVIEYTGWISTRVLSTDVSVKLPFRVDMEFRVEEDDRRFGHGTTEGSIRLYHGHHDQNHNRTMFGINMGGNTDPQLTKEAIVFHQPIFGDTFDYPKRGGIRPNEWNKLTWIVGTGHLACVINGEVRYCGENFPYMKLDLSREDAKPIVIGSDGGRKKYFRNIRISQLQQPKTQIIKGALTMVTKQSNNIIPIIHRLVTDEYGENYWLNGCAKYVMECLNEPDYDYWFFAGISGDKFTQVYPRGKHFGGEAYSSTFFHDGDTAFAERLFALCGYAATFVTGINLNKNKTMYLQTLISYIDKGLPVISWGQGTPKVSGVYVGYEEHGKTLLYISGNSNEPERITFEDAVLNGNDSPNSTGKNSGWIFVGEKTQIFPLAQLYREAIERLPAILTKQTDTFFFGAEAFREWANTVENGWFEGITSKTFDDWGMYTNFICQMATNGSCCHGFLQKARELNPDMAYLEEVGKLYKRTADIWNNDNGNDLEALGGGFNVTLEALQNKESRIKIAAKLREAAECMDKVRQLISNF